MRLLGTKSLDASFPSDHATLAGAVVALGGWALLRRPLTVIVAGLQRSRLRPLLSA